MEKINLDGLDYKELRGVALDMLEHIKNIEKIKALKEERGKLGLGPKHLGMRVSAEGVLGRIANGEKLRKDTRFCCGELLSNLKKMGEAYYQGDLVTVDQFLQLYCLDETRPKET